MLVLRVLRFLQYPIRFIIVYIQFILFPRILFCSFRTSPNKTLSSISPLFLASFFKFIIVLFFSMSGTEKESFSLTIFFCILSYSHRPFKLIPVVIYLSFSSFSTSTITFLSILCTLNSVIVTRIELN